MATSVLEQLKSLSKEWKTTKAREAGGFQKVEDGDYLCECEQARIENAKKSQRLQIAWVHKVLDGPAKGRKIFTYQGLGDESNISWAKTAITAHGVDAPKNIENLPKYLEKCLKQKVNVTVVTNGQYTNQYINPLGKSKDDEEDDEEDLELEDL